MEGIGPQTRKLLRVAILSMLSGAIEARDPYTRGHSVRVTALAEAVARGLGCSEERLASLRVGGPLHDIGKLTVSDDVLRKEGRLDARELEQIREHPKAGAKILLRLSALREAIPCVLYHHERWDGNGYPWGKAGEEIPLEARVLAIADAFDAMTSDRPYRRALTHEQAVAEVERCAGSQFDPEIASVFLECSHTLSRPRPRRDPSRCLTPTGARERARPRASVERSSHFRSRV
jgi:putative nucleotidyltransferase with HDIG domain